MNDDIDALLRATRETHPPTEPVTHGSDTLRDEANRLRSEHDLDTTETTEKPNFIARRVAWSLGIIAAGGLLLGGNALAKDLFNNEYLLGADANFSDTTDTWVAGEGDGVSDAAQAVENPGGVDLRIIQEKIEEMNPEALADGLQYGEQLDIPSSVEPKS